jgi:hypothetical protein
MARSPFRYYLTDMRAITRILPLLLLAAVVLPAAGSGSVPTNVQVDAPAAVQSVVFSSAMRMAEPCGSCKVKACSINAVACFAYCTVANALIPDRIGLLPYPSQTVVLSVTPAILDHRGPPDPHPPRPAALS